MNPTVCAVCLTADRPEMTRRAIACWQAQTYEPKRLLIYDSGGWPFMQDLMAYRPCAHIYRHDVRGETIGTLRNLANEAASERLDVNVDIIAHFDSDDVSHPNRLAEQVALLQSSGADCVGYREVLFWQLDLGIPWLTVHCDCGEKYPRSGAPCPKCKKYPEDRAWLYSNPNPRFCAGASLCYWRRAWQARPFPNMNVGEDLEWLRGVKSVGVSVIEHTTNEFGNSVPADEPRLIQTLHGGNTWDGDVAKCIAAGDREWSRAAQWDDYCRRTLSDGVAVHSK